MSGVGYAPEPDTDAGVPVLDGLTVVGRSAARSTDVEAVDAIEPDLLQVSSYNSADSNLPYVLRVREADPPTISHMRGVRPHRRRDRRDARPHVAPRRPRRPSSSSTSTGSATRSAPPAPQT